MSNIIQEMAMARNGLIVIINYPRKMVDRYYGAEQIRNNV